MSPTGALLTLATSVAPAGPSSRAGLADHTDPRVPEGVGEGVRRGRAWVVRVAVAGR